MKRKGFTLIELIVVMVIIGVLIMLGAPKYKAYTKEAHLTRIKVNVKELENASLQYYIKNNDWARLTDEPYTAEQLNNYAEDIYNKTGYEISLEPDGNYYDIDYVKLSNYIKEPEGSEKYLLQNPVGNVYYLDKLTEEGQLVIQPPIVKETILQPTSFNYTGTEQIFRVPVSGIYKLEVWGSQGEGVASNIMGAGGKGGYAAGEIHLKQGELLYIHVGSILYNGGGIGGGEGKAGGGATHIAKVSGLLSTLYDERDKVLIVGAGGGGGSGYKSVGGFGGGLVGGLGTYENKYSKGEGGTQTSGGVCADIYPGGVYVNGSFGRGGDNGPNPGNSGFTRGGGGGGGWYGGSAGGGGYSSGSGGSSYIGGVLRGSMLSGDKTGDGQVLITYIGK